LNPAQDWNPAVPVTPTIDTNQENMPAAPYLPIYELTRGEIVESIHFGSLAVCDSNGRLVAWYGDAQAVAYLRSTAKPFQALPLFEQDGKSAFDLSPAEVALICASHSGTDAHVAAALSIQSKAGVQETDLLCGVHPPYDEATLEAMRERGEDSSPNRHNCSGKHTGMLALARLKNWPLEDYIQPFHPVQQSILGAFAEMCALTPKDIQVGIDGCSAPNFAAPLKNVAAAFARLCDPQALSTCRAEACQIIVSAMTSHPDMVAGPGRFDTRLMEIGRGRIVSKGGAEGYQGIGLLPGALGPGSPVLGIALKISDGDPRGRATHAVSLEILRQLGALSEDELESLADFGPVIPVTNWRKLVVGQARPAFKLQFEGR
jgi:L-asparaginase II